HASRAEPRDARASAPAAAKAALSDGGDRAPGGDAGAVGAGALRGHLDAHDELPARGARARAQARRRRQGDRDADEAAPRLAAFGPASRRDIVAWTMMHVPEISRALERLEPLVRFRDEHDRELLDVPRAPLPDADAPAPVRFLPKWDNVLLAFADRTRVLPEQYRKTVIRMNGDVAQTFLVDGFVAGLWRVEDGRVLLEPFSALPRSVRRELQNEAERL